MQFLFAPFAPPLRGLPCPAPLGAALRAAGDDPRSASRRSGDGRPRFGHSPAAGPDATSGREPAPGAGHSSPRRHPDTLRGRDPRLGSGWTRFPTHFVVGTRSPPPAAKRSAGFFAADSAALFGPAFAGRASGGGARVTCNIKRLIRLTAFAPYSCACFLKMRWKSGWSLSRIMTGFSQLDARPKTTAWRS